jgi:hypothetical protein
MPTGARLKLLAPAASPEEAAAIVAALERFLRDTAPALSAPAQPLDGWRRAALLDGVSRAPEAGAGHPWINT